MGATITHSEEQTTVRMSQEIQPLKNINLEDMPDAALNAIALSALARGKTKITGLQTLRHKECDRLEVMKQNLEKMGAKPKTTKDSFEIEGNPDILHGADIECYDDHRIAMSFAILGS